MGGGACARLTRHPPRHGGYEDLPGMTWKQMDVCDMPFEDASFDCAIDKACLDSVFCADLAHANSFSDTAENAGEKLLLV